MPNFSHLDIKYPTVKKIEPDSQIILFTKEVLKTGQCPDNIDLIIGMLKYCYSEGIKNYGKEFQELVELYKELNL